VLQSTLKHTVIKSATTGITVEGLAPLLDHVTITECDNTGVHYKRQGWGILHMLECNVSHNSHRSLYVESQYNADTSLYLYRCVCALLLTSFCLT